MVARGLCFLVVVAMFLAGCSGDGGVAEIAPSAGADLGSGSARVEGTVVDPELRPVSAALVELQPPRHVNATGTQVTTGADGRFLFEGLETGRYTVFAARLGYRQAAPQVVDVPEDGNLTIEIVLEPLAILEAHHESKNFVVRFQEQVSVLGPTGPVFTLTGFNAANVTYEWEIDESETGAVETMVVEAQFEHEISVCRAGVEHRLLSPGFSTTPFNHPEGVDKEWTNAPERVDSPTYLHVTAPNLTTDVDTSGDWGVFTWPYRQGSFGTPVDVSCMTNASVDLWWTTFFVEPAPTPDWSLLPP